jgi:poly-gamma-glutamate synthesis protein (capsule biosynthesis protein)
MRLLLTGDVMCGRGIDQILARPGDPTLHERWAHSALDYVRLAEARSGLLPRRAGPAYVWGEMLEVFGEADVRVVNLETAVTEVGDPWPAKGIHYRMHPENAGCLTAAGIDIAVAANNHVMDWSLPGLRRTLEVLGRARIRVAGAGVDHAAAWTPASVSTPEGRVLVVAAGSPSSGIPPAWAAGDDRPGVALIGDLSERTVEAVAAQVRSHARPADTVVVSLHWGPNWGYRLPEDHRRFARGLIDRAGVHLVHGHSSHHPLGMEVYRGHLILYGCGDLLTDYEGIRGHEGYRGELGALYLPDLEAGSGRLRRLLMVPTEVRRFRLVHPAAADARWLAGILDRESSALGARIEEADGSGRLELRW